MERSAHRMRPRCDLDATPWTQASESAPGLTSYGRGGGRVGLYAGSCLPGALRRRGRRPSIWDRRCRRPRAVHPRTRAGSPRSSAQSRQPTAPLDLAPDGVYRAAQVALGAGGLLHHRFTLTGSRGPAAVRPAVCFLWHCPAGHPGWALPTILPCGVRTFLGEARRRWRGPRRGRPAGSSAVPAMIAADHTPLCSESGDRSAGVRWPERPSVRSRSASRLRSTWRTPSSPPCASP